MPGCASKLGVKGPTLNKRRCLLHRRPLAAKNRRAEGPALHKPLSMIRVLRETHTAAAGVAKRLARAGGLNRFGEPNFRAVWGWSRLAWIGGKFEDRDASGALVRETVALRLEPKYAPLDRWALERVGPAE